MSDMRDTRTTITLPEWLLFEIKKKALIERKTIKEIIQEKLSVSLGFGKKALDASPSLLSLFGAWGKGESGVQFLKRIRYGKDEKARETYLKKVWKKS